MDEILNLIESVSEDFPSYSLILLHTIAIYDHILDRFMFKRFVIDVKVIVFCLMFKCYNTLNMYISK